MIVHLTLVVLALSTTGSSLVAPFNRGNIREIEEFIERFARDVADQTASYMRRASFSGSTSGSHYRFRYWGVRVSSLSIYPTISIWNDGNQLGVNGHTSGSIRAAGSWSLDKDIWFYPANFAGQVDVQSSSFSISNRIILGEKSNGKFGVWNVPSACSASVSGLSVDVSGSWFSWLLNFVAWYFEDELSEKLEEEACKKINAVIGEELPEFEFDF